MEPSNRRIRDRAYVFDIPTREIKMSIKITVHLPTRTHLCVKSLSTHYLNANDLLPLFFFYLKKTITRNVPRMGLFFFGASMRDFFESIALRRSTHPCMCTHTCTFTPLVSL